MKTTLTFTKKQIPGIPAGSASRFPALRDPIKSTIEARLDEDDGLFVNYGMFSDSLPYAADASGVCSTRPPDANC